MQALVPGEQGRIAHDIGQRNGGGFTAAEHEVFIKGVIAVGDAENSALAGQLQRLHAEVIGKRLLFTKLTGIVITVFFQIVTVITEGAVKDMSFAESAGFKHPVYMAIPDGDLVGAGDQRPVPLHHPDGVGKLIGGVEIIIVHADDVLTLRQRVEHVAFFTQR